MERNALFVKAVQFQPVEVAVGIPQFAGDLQRDVFLCMRRSVQANLATGDRRSVAHEYPGER